MALLTNWDYLAIEEVKPNEVIIRLHADAEHRARFKAQTESKFERTIQWAVSLTVDLAKPFKSLTSSTAVSSLCIAQPAR